MSGNALSKDQTISSGAGPKPAASGNWHAETTAGVLSALHTGEQGLSEDEVQRRLAETGPNRLAPPAPPNAFLRFARQFHNTLIYVLLAAAAMTAALAHWIDTGVILGVVVINAAIGALQEGRAERALDAIRNLLSPQATVIRHGRRLSVPAETIVPGDIVFLEPGNRVPADMRLLNIRNLRIEEAILTGESVPAEKNAAPTPPSAPLAERASMAYSGTLVVNGQGTGIVIATGDATEIGRVSSLLARVTTIETPLIRQMARFGHTLTAAILALAAATFLFGIAVHDYTAEEMLLAAVGLAVAAIPEGLPAIMTITLAIGVERMARRNAIIRRLPAVETLGSVSIICSDKTGTFTHNQMTVQSLATARHLFEVTGAGYRPQGEFCLCGEPADLEHLPRLQALTVGALLCCEANVRPAPDGSEDWIVEGDPMEAALHIVGMKAGLDPDEEARRLPRTDTIPFDPEHRFMATLHHDSNGEGHIYVKGAPERILAMCRLQRAIEGDEPIDENYWLERIDEISARGERVLALAMKTTHAAHRTLDFSDIDSDLTLVGLFGLADPPRAEAIEAVSQCRSAGMRVKMITGDHGGTARAIAERLGLENTRQVLTGADLDALEDEAFQVQAHEVDVFARTSPEHKLRLVESLQSRGAIVAMTGDGVNDAPALKRADVGIAMGERGAEVAKEAAEMVLADDNFASIAHAAEEGRTVYDNIKKAILFILPTNGGEAFTIIAAILLGKLLPITAVQILWVNMITAVTLALALAFEPPERDVMKRPPRPPEEPLLSRFLAWRILSVSLVLVAGVFGVFEYMLSRGETLDTARTVAVNTLVLFEVFYLFNVRRLSGAATDGILTRAARPAWIAVGTVLLFQGLYTFAPPMQFLFGSAPLAGQDLALIVAIAFTVFALVELEKNLIRRWRKETPAKPAKMGKTGAA